LLHLSQFIKNVGARHHKYCGKNPQSNYRRAPHPPRNIQTRFNLSQFIHPLRARQPEDFTKDNNLIDAVPLQQIHLNSSMPCPINHAHPCHNNLTVVRDRILPDGKDDSAKSAELPANCPEMAQISPQLRSHIANKSADIGKSGEIKAK
jgi:hypothetical protein